MSNVFVSLTQQINITMVVINFVNLNVNVMKSLLFIIFFSGYLFMLIAIYTTNMYLLGLSELFIIVATILLIRLNYITNGKF